MTDPGQAVKESSAPPPAVLAGRKALMAVIFGTVFGFLLQKGGVGKYNVLLGQLLLQDFTVAKVMLTAIVVGMSGVFTLHHFAKANLHLQPTKIGAQIIGGTVFGIGFALIAYCPGTGPVALGQGSWDVLFGMAGLIAGSHLFAEMSGWLKRTVETWGDQGKVMLPDLLHLPRGVFVPLFALILIIGLFLLEHFTHH
ncbi:MAG: YeeE/YedE family protein [Verrucomicrobia bacterium]|nr:YeeE/YedE family protein [Verrucomicrobiota bacterium]